MSERGVVFRSQVLEKEVYRRICGFLKMLAVLYSFGSQPPEIVTIVVCRQSQNFTFLKLYSVSQGFVKSRSLLNELCLLCKVGCTS